MADARYRLDDLRRFASALLGFGGLSPGRASALAAHLLWHDTAGRPEYGLASLADWLDRLQGRVVDPAAEGSVTGEMTGTVLFDGRNGVGPLALHRAAELAAEKARDAGVGLVRVLNIGGVGPGAAIAAELAVGPYVGAVASHDGAWALALPGAGGLPLLFDALLGAPHTPALPAHLLPWAAPLVPQGGWLVGAVAVAALEPLGTFHERIEAWLQDQPTAAGVLRPDTWEERRRAAREHGVAIPASVWQRLEPWAASAQRELPAPTAGPERNR